MKASIKKKNLIKSIKKNYLDFSVPISFSIYACLFGLEFKMEWHRHFFIFGIYIFPVLIFGKILFDAIKMGREDSK